MMMKPGQQNGYLKSLNILFLAMLMGMILFTGISVFLIQTNSEISSFKDNQQLLQVLALGIAAFGYFFAARSFKTRILAMQNFSSLSEKAAAYRSACIIQWALIEGPTLFVIVCFILTGNYAFLGLVVLLLLLFMTMKPTKEKIFVQTGITGEELDNL